MDERINRIGFIIKKKFLISLLIGFMLLGTFIGSFGFTSTMFVLPIGGIGDFHVTFDKLEGKGFSMSPRFGRSDDSTDDTSIRSSFQSVTIYGLHLYKDFKLPTGEWIRVNIHANQPTEIEGLIQDARFIEANLQLDGMAMNQSSEDTDVLTNWIQNEQTVTITNGEMVTDYLFQNMITLNGAEFSIEMLSEYQANEPSAS
ncbi:hypothetical protein GWK91_06930 [Virgibacillus sp. MSP4-1]|uniref:DUF6230 family protein n=1 Tax=Virgibacillus sp. MSP4-1 TaxID=2700081 RepID=UPI0003A90A2F|nr:DUF6230 family protein [Virgibacillus sp. MSP4-1]QHS22696.1 hypothetical protein GWK91_06930 [Virgibacillus sp. MSP4-1]